MNSEQIENEKYLKNLRKQQLRIVLHPKYGSINISEAELSILTIIGNAETYNDLPNFPIEKILDHIMEKLKR